MFYLTEVVGLDDVSKSCNMTQLELYQSEFVEFLNNQWYIPGIKKRISQHVFSTSASLVMLM